MLNPFLFIGKDGTACLRGKYVDFLLRGIPLDPHAFQSLDRLSGVFIDGRTAEILDFRNLGVVVSVVTFLERGNMTFVDVVKDFLDGLIDFLGMFCRHGTLEDTDSSDVLT